MALVRIPRRVPPVVGLVVLAALLRLPRFNESLWYDEIYYSTHFRFFSWAKLLGSLATSVAAPVYRLLLFGWVEAFGEAEIVVRLPSLLFGLGSIVIAYQIGKLYAGPRVAFLAGLLLVLSPVHVWYSQEATPYALLLFLVLAAAWLGELLAEPGGWLVSRFALYLLSLLGAVLTHYYAVLTVLPLSLLALGAPRPARRRLMGANALALVLFAGLVAVKMGRDSLRTAMAFLRPFDLFNAWMFVTDWLLHGNTLAPVTPYAATPAWLLEHPLLLTLQVVAAAILVRGVVRSLRDGAGRRRGAVLVAHFAVYPLAMGVATLVGLRQLYIERYLVVALPFFAILFCRGAAGFRRANTVAAFAVVALGVASYAGWWAQPRVWTVYKQNPEWRVAARDILAVPGFGDQAVVLGTVPLDDLAFYLHRFAGGRSVPRIESADGFNTERAARRGMRTVFLAQNLLWRGEFASALARFDADARFRRTDLLRFPDVEIYRFDLI